MERIAQTFIACIFASNVKRKLNVVICIIITLSYFSCQEEDFGYDSNHIAYESAFVKTFGKPDPNHTWGFIEQPILNYGASQTRTVNTNSNQWADPNYYALNVPADITAAEAEYVYNWFATNDKPVDAETIHWSDFFIQYVNSYNEHENVSNRNMDQLGYESMDGQWEHVNNFNTQTHAIQYVYNAGTENWTYRASHSNTYQYELYFMKWLSFEASDGKHYEGWYIGFDYESKKGDAADTERDGKYNDWIVKVSPGDHQGYPITVRVMCEDLGNSLDWDFNDVVFDVSFSKIETYYPERKTECFATIVLQAVGGTLPIFVGTTDERYEAHALLGDGSMTPIIHPNATAIYTVPISVADYNSKTNTANAKSIPIYVRGTSATYQIESSDIPQKFACPDNVQWSEELVNICDTYPNVPTWIQNEGMGDAAGVWKLNPKK